MKRLILEVWMEMKSRFKFDAMALFIGLCGIIGILVMVAIVLAGVEFLINIAR